MAKGAIAVPESSTMAAKQLDRIRQEALSCRACPLWEGNAQTVFGEGPATADVMFIGEAPGAQEDAQGRPFVGPAGRLFDEALSAAGIERDRVYVTNAVKHRPWTPTRTGRRNRPPRQSEVNACAMWLDLEIELVRPKIICCLGAVAARRIFGRDFKLMSQRGQWIDLAGGTRAIATVHPSFVMLQRRRDDADWFAVLVDDLGKVRAALEHLVDRRATDR